MFGKKGLGAQPPRAPQDGYAYVDAHLARTMEPGSLGFAHAIGQKVFDSAYHALKDERGVRIENIVAMLASVAGQFCLVAVLEALREEGRQPTDIGMVTVAGADGHTYYFGDAPNRLLCEAEHSFVSLVFGAAHQHGGQVSLEMMRAEIGLVARRVGSSDFMALDLPAAHQVDSPLNWARAFTGFVVAEAGKQFREVIAEKMGRAPTDLGALQVPQFLMPRIVGFAVQQAIDVGHRSLDPTMLARIAMLCSLRSAKLDPEWVFGNP
jgi:hypothetical protein